MALTLDGTAARSSNDMTTLSASQQMHIETSRKCFLMLTQADCDLRELERNAATMTVAEFNRRKLAIEEWRETLKEQWRKHNGT